MIATAVHAAGAAVYLVFFLLLLAASQIPRSQAGAIYWAGGTLAAFFARITLLILPMDGELPTAFMVYACLITVEKFLLLAGCLQFFGRPLSRGWLSLLAIYAVTLFILCVAGLLSRLQFDLLLSAYNVLALLLVSVVIWRSPIRSPRRIRFLALLTSVALALHWSTLVPGYLWIDPQWKTLGFVVGTPLVLLQYYALLAAVFVLFRQRLLESEEQAMAMAFQDPLTGLNNKRYVDVLFQQALLLANRPYQLLAVFYIDLDRFKPINDSAGHKAGDLVLKELAARLKQSLRSTDICARVGGDEFVVLATQLEQPAVVHDIAAKLLHQLTQPVLIAQQSYQLGASIGVSLYPHDGNELAELLEKADMAMYQVKKSGHSGWRLYADGQPGEVL